MHSSCKQRRHTLYRTQLWTVHCSKHGVDNAAGYELCGHDKNGLGCTWKKEILDTVVVVGLGGFCSKLLLCYAPMLSTTSYMYYALGWVLLCSINKLIMLGVITCNFQYTLLTDYKLPCDTCVHTCAVCYHYLMATITGLHTCQGWEQMPRHVQDQRQSPLCSESSATFYTKEEQIMHLQGKDNRTHSSIATMAVHYLASSLYSKICSRVEAIAPGSSVPTTIIAGCTL